MEPTKTAYAIYTKVVSVTEEEYAVRGRIVDGQAVIDKAGLGWFVLFEGSHEKLFLGLDRPELSAGDPVKILIERLPMMTRDEHLQWCKDRATEYLHVGDLKNAYASMVSDLTKHNDTKFNDYLLALGIIHVTQNDHEGMRRWIDGFR